MRRIILTLLAAAMAAGAVADTYTVYSASRFVNLLRKGAKALEVKRGMTVHDHDIVEVPSGGILKIEHTGNHEIYSSTCSGRMRVSDLARNARELAADNRRNVGRKFNGQNFQAKAKSMTVFVKKGVVRRDSDSLEEAAERTSSVEMDTTVNDIWTDSALLGHIIASKIIRGDSLLTSSTPIEVKGGRDTEGAGLYMEVTNPLECPIYVNVVKVAKCDDGLNFARISRIGQPVCCYVMLPGQVLMRKNLAPVDSGERHIVVISPYLYDIDTLVEQMNISFENPEGAEDFSDIPIFATEL